MDFHSFLIENQKLTKGNDRKPWAFIFWARDLPGSRQPTLADTFDTFGIVVDFECKWLHKAHSRRIPGREKFRAILDFGHLLKGEPGNGEILIYL
jgi:hypothetical protein